jgi:hypothetical protein
VHTLFCHKTRSPDPFLDIEARAEIATRKLEEKERRRAQERELRLAGMDDGSEESDESDGFIERDEDDENFEMGDEPEPAVEMIKNIFETGTKNNACYGPFCMCCLYFSSVYMAA